jgi:DNA-binding IclR family transcriptional regulator
MDQSERRDLSAREALLDKIRMELRHLPGLALTAEQASRLFGIPDTVCSRLLSELVEQGAMSVRRDGRFAARDA